MKVRLGDRTYSILIGSGIFDKTGSTLSKVAKSKRVAIISNRKVDKLFGGICRNSLEKSGFNVSTLALPDGERFKNLAQIEKIYKFLVKENFDRSDTIVALGGGVVGDMAGFAAATYMRGITFVQAPTTLLAQVDSSVGGKTGVDFPGGKNLIGAFYQPATVIADISALQTLPEREFRCGMAEVIKYGIIKDRNLFSFLEKNVGIIRKRKVSPLKKIVAASCRIKADVVERDEREAGVRALLNYGHTFGHAIETALGFQKLKHGEAVAIGMVQAARFSCRVGLASDATVKKISNLIKAYGLPVSMPASLTPQEVVAGMKHDKKIICGRIRFVLIKNIGDSVIEENLSYSDALKSL